MAVVPFAAMLKLLAITLGVLGAGCTFYTSCPHSNSTGTSCSAPDNSSQGGAGQQAAGGNSQNAIGGSAPTDPWVDATGNLAGIKTDFGNVAYLSAMQNEDKLIAGLSGVGLFASVDGAQTWDAMGTAKGSAAVQHRTTALLYDPDHSNVFWESGMYGAGVFKTTDAGRKFTQLGDITHIEALAIDFSDPDRQTMLAPGHEQGLVLWLSVDSGQTWKDIGSNLPKGASVCSYPVILDSRTFLVTCSLFNAAESGTGIFRSTDTGQSWEQVSTRSAWQAALYASDGAIYWAAESGGGLLKGTDLGLTWTQTLAGSVQAHAIELPSGSIVVPTERYLILSDDHGATWRPVSSQLPFPRLDVVYAPFQKSFFIWTGTAEETVPDGVLQRYEFDDSAVP
jgi:hypothetical protein